MGLESETDAREAVVVDALETRFGDRVDRTTLEALVSAQFARWSQARIRDFLPILAEKQLRQRLTHRLDRVPSGAFA
jgi:hypothetical protein